MGVVQGDSRAVKTLAKDTGQILGSVALARFTRARRSLSQPGRKSFDRVLQLGTQGARRSRGPGLVLNVRITGDWTGPPTLWHQRQLVEDPLSSVLDGRLVGKSRGSRSFGAAQGPRGTSDSLS